MPLQFTYTPPAVNGIAVVHAAAILAEQAGAHALLAASKPGVPVRSGELVASGEVVQDGIGAAVAYSATNPKDGYNYAIKQHEDMDLNHPNGGGPKWLENAMNTEHVVITEAMAAVMRKVI